MAPAESDITYLFYRRHASAVADAVFSLPNGYRSIWWRPKGVGFSPPGVKFAWRFMAWRLLFSVDRRGRGYGALLVLAPDGKVAHCSMVFPRYFRFPFMSDDDLQVGATFTAPPFRSMGLASYALQEIVRQGSSPDQAYWYVVAADNAPSIRVAEKNSFHLHGTGRRTRVLRSALLGAFALGSDQ